MERDAELRKSQDEAGVEMLGQTEHASSEIGGRLPHKNVRWFLHKRPPKKEEKHYKENTASAVRLYRHSHADQALFLEQVNSFFY